MTTHLILVSCIMFKYFGFCGADPKLQSFFSLIAENTLAEDGKLNITQLASKYGHSAETHDVITEDGYILELFHLPGDKPSVLLFHGLTDSSDSFFIRGNTSLAITLANAGYNVWVGNNRGNKFGRRHITLDPDADKKEFFDYSLNEIGYFDLPATIDYIRKKTGEDSIVTIGHSQGTAVHYVLGSTRPEYNKRIKVTISLAPIAFLNNLVPPLSLVALAGPEIYLLVESLGIEELFQDQKAVSNLIKLICSKGLISYAICGYGLIFPISGFDPSNIESEFLRVIIGHYPSATSKKGLAHFDQIILRKRFSQYDYGLVKNMAKYGTVSPPDYDLSAVTMKVALLVGNNDKLATVKDAEHLRDCLPNVVHYQVLEPKLWAHGDFVWGKDMPKYLYPSIFRILKKYT